MALWIGFGLLVVYIKVPIQTNEITVLSIRLMIKSWSCPQKDRIAVSKFSALSDPSLAFGDSYRVKQCSKAVQEMALNVFGPFFPLPVGFFLGEPSLLHYSAVLIKCLVSCLFSLLSHHILVPTSSRGPDSIRNPCTLNEGHWRNILSLKIEFVVMESFLVFPLSSSILFNFSVWICLITRSLLRPPC